ncbi:phage late control D family protein [Bacillus solitudinis]|uniref:phage late control D family protein n=1 Tax=Bacillus solitudinis TaxID=2014074 RepID=UPI000C238409|nr:hypothetical protein [Bacillus solitudinis]
MEARRASVAVTYQGIDITDEVSKDLLSFEYTDNASGDSDSVSLTLKDDKKIWLRDWFPEKGDIILPTIQTTNWRQKGDKQSLPCGRFFVDEPSYEGRPGVITLNAVASPLNSNFSSVARSKSWRNITLRAIAGDIAKRAGLQLQFMGTNNPRFVEKAQTEVSDSSFLSDLCEEEALAMKLTDSKIVIFDEREFERRKAVVTYSESNDRVIGYSFRTSLANTKYAGVNVKYHDSSSGQTISYLHTIGEIDENSKIYQVNKKVRSGDEARRLAQRTLRKLNKRETIASLTLVGNVELLGGVCVNIKEFGAFTGKYYIEKATHSIGGFQTTIEARKVLEGY